MWFYAVYMQSLTILQKEEKNNEKED